MGDTPAALQLRLLQTVVEVAAEKNSTLVLPFPVELLRFLDSATTRNLAEQPADRPAPAPPSVATPTPMAAPNGAVPGDALQDALHAALRAATDPPQAPDEGKGKDADEP